MTDPAGTPAFDEAAYLYVQYLSVVREMERAFEQAVDKFLCDVRETINGLSAPLRINDERTPKYMSWWLGANKDESLDVPYVWFEYRRPQIVIPGELRVTVDIEKECKSLCPKVENALRQIELPSYCHLTTKPDYGAMATLVISYGESSRPVQDVAEALVIILKAIEPFSFSLPSD